MGTGQLLMGLRTDVGWVGGISTHAQDFFSYYGTELHIAQEFQRKPSFLERYEGLFLKIEG